MPAHVLDELAVAPIAAVNATLVELGNIFANRVGPIVEYELFRRHNRPELPPLHAYCDSPIVQYIAKLLDGQSSQHANLSLQSTVADTVGIPPSLGADAAWTAFVKRAEATARAVGFTDSVSAGLAGAIRELADNVIQHSEASASGIAAFARVADRFEYVVADSGIGMLASLRRAPEFRSLRDDLEALPLAVTPGVSRHGRSVGYGYGYRAVFLPLRAAYGSVRLRSGRAVLQMAGAGPRPVQGRCSQRPYHQGVAVSVEISPTASMGVDDA
jgi:hypothetical protein